MTNYHIDSILKLLDDPDDEVFNAVQSELFEQGIDVVKKLEEMWENSTDQLVQKRIEFITQHIQLQFVSNNLKQWFMMSNSSLFDALLWISRYQYPDLDVEVTRKKYFNIIDDVNILLSDQQTPLEKIRVINFVIFNVCGFTRSFTGYNSPQHYYINNLLDTKRGNFLSLSLLYASVAQTVGVPLYSVELPENLILAFGPNPETGDFDYSEIGFYVNPSNNGTIFSRLEIDSFLMKIGITRSNQFYMSRSNKVVVAILMKSLILSYQRLGYKDKSEELNNLLRSVAPDY